MKTADRIKEGDRIEVSFYDEDGFEAGKTELTNVHTLDDAAVAAYEKLALPKPIEDYSMRISNLTQHTYANYRINAHGHIKLEV